MTNSNLKPQRILVVALSGIGNFLMQSPAISLLRNKFPRSHITAWVAPRGTKILAQNHQAIDEVIEASVKRNFSIIPILRQRHFDVGIVLSPGQLIKSALYLTLAGIPRRIGNSYPFAGRQHSRLFLTDTVDENSAWHDIEQNIRLLKPLGITNDAPSIAYTIHLPAQASQQAAAWLAQNNIPNSYLIGLHAGSAPDFLWKRWPLANFAQVTKELLAKHPTAKILLFGGPDETAQKQALQQLIGKEQTMSVQADLLTTAAIMRQCALVIANDSGLMHLAAAAGVPTVGLFGPTDETKTGPRGPKSCIVRAAGTKPSYNTETNYHIGSQPDPSMLAITPADVVTKIAQILP